MNTEIEDLLAEGIDRLTAGSQLPRGLAGRVRAAARRRMLAVTAAAAAGTAAAVTGAAVLAIGSASPAARISHHPGQAGVHRPTSTGPVLTTAYVIARVVHAVARQANASPVLYIRTLFTGYQFPRDTGYPSGTVQLSWTRGLVYRTSTLRRDGEIAFASRSVTSGTAIRILGVNYRNHTWSVDHGATSPNLAGNACMSNPSPVPDCPGSVASQIRHDVAAGKFHVVGHQVVDGVNAIKLTNSQFTGVGETGKPHRFWNGVERQTLWVDAKTFLPVRWTTTVNIPKLEWNQNQQDIRWLPPTRANLAQLRLTIPTGFRYA